MVRRIGEECIGLLLIALFLFLFIFIDFTSLLEYTSVIPKSFLNMNTMFLSIFLEAIPFVMIGVFVSSWIQTYVTEERIQRILPQHAFMAMIPASLIGVIMPMCECVIVPVVHRLIRKGLPLHIGMVLLVSVPIINPLVFASTYFAFSSNESMAYLRVGLAFLIAIIIGTVVYMRYNGTSQLVNKKEKSSHHVMKEMSRWREVIVHASNEFFSAGKYLLIGACIASLFQTFLNREWLTVIADNDALSPLVMMSFAYVLSLCSEADAFVAASFSHTFSAESLLAFLLFGAMIDVKNTLMMVAYFKKRFVLSFIVLVALSVYGVTMIASYF
ncbi:permease [Priestia taiwanensis]|uniref:Permease n=1 Tax=Priestia taiwanensis TaxID=1347902 RepID=A0A917EMA7_9BACI|nr:permease [Priestia taiwanensis]MBM7362176.1 uncharacterized membrane protein YraQ (UPF0718 family) [Priestia taiwanensis]GGE59991.1 permease [Priestia taiwanensis]